MVTGITLSKWSGDVDFDRMVDAGVGFVSIRATIGDEGVDEQFFEYWRGAEYAGLLRRSFHLVNSDNPIAQVNNFLGIAPSGDLEYALDYEDATIPEFVVKTMAYELWKKTGSPPAIYTRANIWDQLGDTDWTHHFPLWVAHYGVDNPTIPAAWSEWDYWQVSDSVDGSQYGVLGNTAIVDRFNGQLSQLSLRSMRYRQLVILKRWYPDVWLAFYNNLT